MNWSIVLPFIIIGIIAIGIIIGVVIYNTSFICIDISGKRNVDYDFEITKWLNVHWNEVSTKKPTKFQFIRYYKNAQPKIELRKVYSFDELTKLHRPVELSPAFQAEQRRLMTPKLRQQIMERDNYTCQLCGRYMPDGNGLHIDHIIPVSKGGRTEPSNLQVLCQKCNNHKSNK